MELYEPQGEEPLHTFDWTDSTQPSAAVVVAVCEVSGDDPTAIEPLYTVVDPDSLDALFAPARTPRLDGSVEFEYHGYRVAVTAAGSGFVFERNGSETSVSPSLRSDGNPAGEYR